MLQANVTVFPKKVYVTHTTPPDLLTQVGNAIARTCRNRYDIAEIQIVLHERIEHTRRKSAAHATTPVLYCVLSSPSESSSV